MAAFASRHRLVLLSSAASLAVACSHAPQTTTPSTADRKAENRDKSEIIVDSTLIHGESKDVIAAWLVYGGQKVALWEARTPRRADQAADDFSFEVLARTVLASSWKQSREQGVPPNAELDLMVDLQREGLLEPYLLTYFAVPGWTIPPDALARLDFARFRAWAGGRLDGHAPRRHVALQPRDGHAFPIPAGAALPSPDDLDPRRASCAQSRGTLDLAMKRWAEEEARLAAAPVAAHDRRELVLTLEQVRHLRPFSERGVVWAAPKVKALHFLAGFCAVDDRRWDDAEKALTKTMALAPADGGPRAELAHVYMGLHRLDEADALLADALRLAAGDCERARVMRGQGYVLVERGRLLEAFQTYARSQELDPKSEVAKKEMAFILSELRRRGGADAAKVEGYTPPSVRHTTVSDCAR